MSSEWKCTGCNAPVKIVWGPTFCPACAKAADAARAELEGKYPVPVRRMATTDEIVRGLVEWSDNYRKS